MIGNSRALSAFISICLILLCSKALAHGFAGNRFFPATIATDDPAVAEELSLPTVSWIKNSDGAEEISLASEYSKRITPNFGVSFEESWSRIHAPGGPNEYGFDNLGTSFKYRFFKSDEAETIASAGVDIDWGGTGTRHLGAESFTTFTPTLFFGKGMGDLPDSLALVKPFAVTGLVGYSLPTKAHDGSDPVPQALTYGIALEYSLPYLSAHVRDFGWPRFINHLTPIIEASFETPVVRGNGERTTGTINPGLIWTGRYTQIGIEANLPINRDTAKTAGVTLQLHFFIDDLFPHSLGAPLFKESEI
ncbi:MAG: hypothetical protein WAW96_17200 [Alphaproteobacteria bacterium]